MLWLLGWNNRPVEATPGLWAVLIAAAAVAVPAALGLYYFVAQRNREKRTVTNALRSEINRLTEVLQGHLRWIDKPQSRKLPIVAFETRLYDSHLGNIGMLDAKFAKEVVHFYGALHFVNALQKARADYYEVENGVEYFFHSYRKAILKAIEHLP